MKFACGKAYDDKVKRWLTWHTWFAWYPVKVGLHDCRWLEFVERKWSCGGGYDGPYWCSEYQAIPRRRALR